MRWLLALVVALWGGAAAAEALQLEGDLVQGGLVRGAGPGRQRGVVRRAPPAGRSGRRLPDRLRPRRGERSGADGALSRRHRGGPAPGDRAARLRRSSGSTACRRIRCRRARRNWSRIEAEARLIAAARRAIPARPASPARSSGRSTGRISGVYGSQRILNGEPRRPHRGVDVAAPSGTPIGAMADGVVSLAVPAMYFTGGTVMIDHGHGLHSLYAHLSAIDVAAGQPVRRGATIGKVGATGRVTGPHLHWGVFWFERALDPALLVGPMPRP